MSQRRNDASEQVGASLFGELVDDRLHRLGVVAARDEDSVRGERDRHVGHTDERHERPLAVLRERTKDGCAVGVDAATLPALIVSERTANHGRL